MALYDRLALTAKRLFDKFGRTVYLRQRTAASDYDTSNGSANATDEAVDDPRKGLVLDQPGSQISQRFGNNHQANTLVQQSEKWIYLDALGVRPCLQDKLIVDDIEYAIIDVQEIGPGGIAVLYMLVIRA